MARALAAAVQHSWSGDDERKTQRITVRHSNIPRGLGIRGSHTPGFEVFRARLIEQVYVYSVRDSLRYL